MGQPQGRGRGHGRGQWRWEEPLVSFPALSQPGPGSACPLRAPPSPELHGEEEGGCGREGGRGTGHSVIELDHGLITALNSNVVCAHVMCVPPPTPHPSPLPLIPNN